MRNIQEGLRIAVGPSIRAVAATTVGIAALALLSGCGGSGDSGGGPGNGGSNPGGSISVPYTAGVYPKYDTLADQCEFPRTGIDPFTQLPYPDKKGSAAAENNWLRSWINDTYLWYREVPDLNPNSTSDPLAYFDLLRTSERTSSGAPKDKFHFWYETDVWELLSQSGVSSGYGAQWLILESFPPRDIRVAYVEPGSPAEAAGLHRGDVLLAVDGIDAINANTRSEVDVLNAGTFPDSANQTHTFKLHSRVGDVDYTVQMISADIESTPVQKAKVVDVAGKKVGYMQFNDHIATAEEGLVDAVNALKNGGAQELVLDIRYNGGGYLAIASQLAYMIAGPSRTNGKVFERLSFNDKYPNTDPVAGGPAPMAPFYSTTLGFSLAEGAPLPTLNLSRVFVLTGGNTCSASESIMNGLRGVDVEVIQIGGTTCGKPYGFYPTPNCGITYFAIQFQGVNAKSFGDYTDGFSPANMVTNEGTKIPGCAVADDFNRELGEVDEARFAAAIQYIGNGSCPTPPTGSFFKSNVKPIVDGYMPKSPVLQNRILRPAR